MLEIINYMGQPIFVLPIVLIVLTLITIFVYKILKSIIEPTNQQVFLLIKLIGLYILLSFLLLFSTHPFDFILTPLTLLRSSIPAILAFWLGCKFFLQKPSSANAVDTIEEPVLIQQAVAKILDSDYFLTTLRKSLPKGDADPKYGLDYVPFMLDKIEERRKKFETSSNRFFTMTFIFGIIFSSIVLYFGYILVNEKAAGAPRTLEQIKDEIKALNGNFTSLTQRYPNNPVFQNMVGLSLLKLRRQPIDQPNQPLADRIKEIIDTTERTGDIQQLRTTLSDVQKELNDKQLSFENRDGRAYEELLRSVNSDLSSFLDMQEKRSIR